MADKLIIQKRAGEEDFDPWMLLERRQRRQGRSEGPINSENHGAKSRGSQFAWSTCKSMNEEA